MKSGIKIKFTHFFPLFSFFFVFSSNLLSQTNFTFSGTVAENDVMALEGANVTLFEDFEKIAQVTTSGKGRFSFTLEMNKDYVIEFGKQYYVSKKISISTEFPGNCKKAATEFDMGKISLFKFVEGVNYSILKKPILYFQYSEKCKFGLDEKYYATIAPILKDFETKVTKQQMEIAKLSTEDEEKKREEAKLTFEQFKKEVKIEEEKEKFRSLSTDEKYAELTKQADEKLKNGDYEGARQKYTEALKFKPGNFYAESQLMKLEALIAEKNRKQRASEEQAGKANDAGKPENYITEQPPIAAKNYSERKSEKATEALLLKIADDAAVRTANAKMEKQREIEKAMDMKNILAHAAAKRIFLEEIADSKIKMKQTPK